MLIETPSSLASPRGWRTVDCGMYPRCEKTCCTGGHVYDAGGGEGNGKRSYLYAGQM